MTPTVVFPQAPMASTLEQLDSGTRVIVNDGDSPWPTARLHEATRDADALVAFMTERIDADLLAQCPRLRIVAGALKGTDNIDIGACTRHGVWVTAVPALLTAPTAELAVGLMIGLGRHLRQGDRHVRSGGFTGWTPCFYGTGLTGATVGMVGMGAIGQAIAKRLLAFDAHVIYTDRQSLRANDPLAAYCHRSDLDTLLAQSDYLILAAPLSQETEHLIGAERLAQLRPHALIINPGRGSVVDEQAVGHALEAGEIGGYAADVFEMEDASRPDRPDTIPDRLLNHPRTLFTPHLGSAVTEVRRRIEAHAAGNVQRVLEGETPLDAVNRPHVHQKS